jgi:hypothetical protein
MADRAAKEFSWPCGPPIAMKVVAIFAVSFFAVSYGSAQAVEVGSALDLLKPLRCGYYDRLLTLDAA